MSVIAETVAFFDQYCSCRYATRRDDGIVELTLIGCVLRCGEINSGWSYCGRVAEVDTRGLYGSIGFVLMLLRNIVSDSAAIVDQEISSRRDVSSSEGM